MMKKTLVALAAAAVAGGAFAQSSVTISGLVDIGYGQVDGSGSATAQAADQQRVAQNGSATTAIIISGSEDIGGGLRAIFRYETNPDFVSGGGIAASNGFSFVGLTGGFGEVRLGRLNSAFLQNWVTVNPLGTALGSGWGGAGVVTRYTVPAGNFAVTAPTRFNGAIEYQSPVFNGIQGRLMYVPERDDAAATANRASVVDAGLRFAQGPITAMLSWQRTDASGAVDAAVHPLGVTTPAAGGDSTLWMLGARYAMGALALSGGYWQEKVELGGVERADITGWTLAVRYTMGPWAFTAAHTQSEDDAVSQIFTATGETGAKRSVLGLGVDYSFSKRTALYGRFEGRDMGPTEFQIIQVGIRHTF
jgi:predicted porin